MNEWTIIKKEVIHKDHWNSVNKNTYKTAKGDLVKDYIILENRPVVMVIAVTKDKKIILVKEYKPGSDKIVTQLPAGYIDDGEEAEKAAKRELLEETGYVASTFEKIGKLYNANGKMTANVTCYLAKNAEKTKEQKLDIHEDIEVIQKTIKETLELIDNGTIDSADSTAFILMGINKLQK